MHTQPSSALKQKGLKHHLKSETLSDLLDVYTAVIQNQLCYLSYDRRGWAITVIPAQLMFHYLPSVLINYDIEER